MTGNENLAQTVQMLRDVVFVHRLDGPNRAEYFCSTHESSGIIEEVDENCVAATRQRVASFPCVEFVPFRVVEVWSKQIDQRTVLMQWIVLRRPG